MDTIPFYEKNPSKAVELIRQQQKDNWNNEDIINYWYALGVSVFFVQAVVKRTLRGEEYVWHDSFGKKL